LFFTLFVREHRKITFANKKSGCRTRAYAPKLLHSLYIFSLIILTFIFSGHYISFDVQQCHANKLFCNKIWQASKYTVMYLKRFPSALRGDLNTSRGDLSKLDRWILSRLAHMVSEVNRALGKWDFHFATSALKTFLYSEFCDFYLVSECVGD
jgi:valyl-tRNA synthetase